MRTHFPKTWSVLLFALCVLSLPAHSSQFDGANWYRIIKNGDHSITVYDFANYQEVDFEGSMMFKDGRKSLRRLNKTLTSNKDILLIIKDSGGGLTNSFKKFAGLLKKKCFQEKGCKITTLVKGRCMSSCVELSLVGTERNMCENATFGFHRMWALHPNLVVQSTSSIQKTYKKLGVDAQWLDENRQLFYENQYDGSFIESDQAILGNLVQDYFSDCDYFINQYKYLR